MKRTLKNTLLLLPLLVVLLFVVGMFINSLGCHYDLKMSANGVNYHGVCRWGKITVIEEEEATREKWRVTGFQLTFFNQLVTSSTVVPNCTNRVTMTPISMSTT
ncbi:hypothetical protein [Aeromonas sp. 11P]|uniref:hypothetical protein n=1 Tax=Aeromonas sp. 11P TaxID=3452713 RepID=UPI003F79D602